MQFVSGTDRLPDGYLRLLVSQAQGVRLASEVVRDLNVVWLAWKHRGRLARNQKQSRLSAYEQTARCWQSHRTTAVETDTSNTLFDQGIEWKIVTGPCRKLPERLPYPPRHFHGYG